ncbi:MAG: hypothetical protein M1817_003597 [Caeruleum heppii]|nr:MAG: hypothetical protein M1817_003597 [Caeruleum heppii]
MDELLRALGETIPQHIAMSPDHGRNEDEQPNLKFQVSCLNAATLTSIAGIQLIWVDTISAHLDFDASVPALYLFRLPSFCRLQSGDDSFLSILTEDLYTENSKSTDDFSVSRLMKEISLSYRMLFRDDRSARELYRRSQRAKASIITATGGRSTDPHLDMLAGLDLPTSFFSPRQHVRETYHADSDFPILRKRLNRIQLYVDGIQPGRLTSLWRDRRDLRLWYTIWAVLIIGGIGVIQAFFAISLAAAQVGIARQSLKLQLQQLPR